MAVQSDSGRKLIVEFESLVQSRESASARVQRTSVRAATERSCQSVLAGPRGGACVSVATRLPLTPRLGLVVRWLLPDPGRCLLALALGADSHHMPGESGPLEGPDEDAPEV
jgi:hypothetical protein